MHEGALRDLSNLVAATARRVPPDPNGQTDGRVLQVSNNAFAFGDAVDEDEVAALIVQLLTPVLYITNQTFLWRLTDPSSPGDATNVGSIPGTNRAIASHNGSVWLIVNPASANQIWEIPDPANPATRINHGTLPTSFLSGGGFVSHGGSLWATDIRNNGRALWEITDPTSPGDAINRGNLPIALAGNAEGLASLQGSIWIVDRAGAALWKLDNPSNPSTATKQGDFPAALVNPHGITAYQDSLLITRANNSIDQLWQLTNPSSPSTATNLGDFPDALTNPLGITSHVAINVEGFSISSSGGSGASLEEVRDEIAAWLQAGNSISFANVDDGDNRGSFTISVSDGGIDTTQLAANSVTLGKLAHGTANKYLGYNASGAPAELDAPSGGGSGDITGVTAGTGLTGGATSGNATLGIANGGVDTTQLAADAVTGAKIADDAVDTEHLADGAVDTARLGAMAVTTPKIAANSVTLGKFAHGTANKYLGYNSSGTPAELDAPGGGGSGDITGVTAGTGLTGGATSGNATLGIANGGVGTTQLAADAVTGAKLADNAVNTEHITSGAVNTARMADNAVTLGKLAHGTADKYIGYNASGVPSELDAPSGGGSGDITGVTAGTGLTGGATSGNATLGIANGGVGTTQLAADAVTSAKIADDAIRTEHLANDAVNAARIADNSVNSQNLATNAVTIAKIAPNAVATGKIADNAVTLAKLAHGAAGKYIGFNDSGVPTELDAPTSVSTVALGSTQVHSETIDFTTANRSVLVDWDIPASGLYQFYFGSTIGDSQLYVGNIVDVSTIRARSAGTAGSSISVSAVIIANVGSGGTNETDIFLGRTSANKLLIQSSSTLADPTPLIIRQITATLS